MELIRNPECGACASIVFYQFAKVLDKLSYEDLKIHVWFISEELHKDCCEIEPIILKYWNGIHDGTIQFEDMPNGMSMHELDNPLNDYGIFGQSEYGLINYFCRIMFFLQTGYWIQDNCGRHVFQLIEDKPIYRKAYDKFMSLFTTKIPYITYFGILNNENILEEDFHIMLTLKINDDDYEVYNSNEDEVIHIERHVSLWIVKQIVI